MYIHVHVLNCKVLAGWGTASGSHGRAYILPRWRGRPRPDQHLLVCARPVST